MEAAASSVSVHAWDEGCGSSGVLATKPTCHGSAVWTDPLACVGTHELRAAVNVLLLRNAVILPEVAGPSCGREGPAFDQALSRQQACALIQLLKVFIICLDNACSWFSRTLSHRRRQGCRWNFKISQDNAAISARDSCNPGVKLFPALPLDNACSWFSRTLSHRRRQGCRWNFKISQDNAAISARDSCNPGVKLFPALPSSQ